VSGRAAPTTVKALVHGAIVGIEVTPGQQVAAGQTLLVQEAMKVEVALPAPHAARVEAVLVAVGDVVAEGAPAIRLQALVESTEQDPALPAATAAADSLDTSGPPGLAALRARSALTEDAARPQAMARRHAAGRMSAREIVAALTDRGSFSELGALAIAAQRSRRPAEELRHETPADGVIAGTATLGGVAIALLVYDATVLAGTQGAFGHQKCDRLFDLAGRQRLPLLLWAEGGGGRPGDVDWPVVAGLHVPTFARLAALAGRVPTIGMVGGRCFAGNAALLGCCDVLLAAEGASIGMGGPAMIEGGGLGRVAADDVGPAAMHAQAGSVDALLADDAAVCAMAIRLLGLWTHPQQPPGRAPAVEPASLRMAVPASRQTAHDPHGAMAALLDADSIVELRAGFGRSLVTAFGRLEGRTVAVLASQPRHRGGALDGEACTKLEQFLRLADARRVPVLSLIDTPGFMVGPEAERTGLVRLAGRVFVQAAAMRVPWVAVVLRRGYGLGAMALAGGHFHAPVAMAAWPNAECGAMGIDGAVKLGWRQQLQAAAARSEAEREALMQRLAAQLREQGGAMNMAEHLEIDTVLDPADTRAWVARALRVAASETGRLSDPG
jgi:acetyl-CoA carboxylase carboxyltransferase component